LSSERIPLVDLKAQFRAIEPEIRAAIDRVLERQSFIIGPETRAFEAEFAAYTGAAEAVAVSNGTTAIELVLWALGIGEGDEVITTGWTYWATAESIIRAGAVPVLVDVREDDWTIDPVRVAGAVTERTKAIMPVHIYGHPADVPALAGFAPVIEDAAQAHGSSYGGRPVGAFARAATYSFYPGKNLGAYGDAGAVTTDDVELTERIRALRDHGRSAKYEHPFVGTNARCSELQCAVLRAKLPHLDEWTEERRRLSSLYKEQLAGLGVGWQATQPWARHVRHLFVITHPERDRIRECLAEEGIDTGVHYPIPVHEQPGLAGQQWRAAGDLAVTERLAREVLSLPLYPELGDEGVERVCAAVERALAKVPA
jgi:dTDP-4-amino-4,6-dideoxygalactose transaminase